MPYGPHSHRATTLLSKTQASNECGPISSLGLRAGLRDCGRRSARLRGQEDAQRGKAGPFLSRSPPSLPRGHSLTLSLRATRAPAPCPGAQDRSGGPATPKAGVQAARRQAAVKQRKSNIGVRPLFLDSDNLYPPSVQSWWMRRQKTGVFFILREPKGKGKSSPFL